MSYNLFECAHLNKKRGEFMMKKKRITALLFGVIAIASSINVAAGTNYVGYDETVGPYDGYAYTPYDHVKSTSGANGYIRSWTVGGTYNVDVRMVDDDGTGGDWRRDLNDGTIGSLDGNQNHLKGESMRLQFSNDWNTPVHVRVTGDWRSDT
jgi:hypothetical protein